MENRKKIALLIDYDNFNREEYFPVLFEELNEIGDILLKYAFYSNFKDNSLKTKFIKYGIEPMSQIAYSTGKNAVDIRMTIEAMDLLGKDYIDCICLATNDSDFTPLVYKLQKSNRYVIGAGDDKAADTYKNTYNMFISVEKILGSKRVEDRKIKITENSALDNLLIMVNDIIDSNHDENGYADFSNVIQVLKTKMKDFNPKNYGANNKQVLSFFQKELKQHYEFDKEDTIYYIKKRSK